MPAAEAQIQTRDPARYLIRLCRHAGKMRSHLGHQSRRHSGGAPPAVRRAEWSETDGVLVFSLGRCTLRAEDGVLRIRAEASSPGSLTQMQELVTRRLEGFGRRERLTVTWQPAGDLPPGPRTASASGAPGDTGTAPG